MANASVAMEAPAITGLSNKAGTIALARSTNLDSATSQFYFNTIDNLSLDAGPYAVFGKVISGMDVVLKLEALPVVTTNSVPKTFADAVLVSAIQTQ